MDRPQGWYTDPEEQTYVRSVFLVLKRSVPLPFMQVFDLPDPNTSCARRDVTTVAPQALNLFNSNFAIQMARAMADRVVAEAGPEAEQQIDRAVWLALSRPPQQGEQTELLELLKRSTASHSESEHPEHDALVDVCRALLNVNEFVYLD